MVEPVEIGLLALALIGLFIAFRLLKAVKGLAINAIIGVVILLAANFSGLVAVNITLWSVLICALGGVPGAILVLILAYFDVAFAAGMLVPAF